MGFSNGHVQTIFPALFRKVREPELRRERITTPDGDFLDLDWREQSNRKGLAILSHGLEGYSRDPYVLAMGNGLFDLGWSVLSWNFRGCSGVPNNLLRSYHSAATEDLAVVIDHALGVLHYESVVLVGFSLGGNLTLKYLGEVGENADPRIRGSVNFSAPADIASSSMKLQTPSNAIYMRRFLKRLTAKVREKISLFPGKLKDEGLDRMTTFEEFDNAYTAPLHGFENARDYWARASSRPGLPRITVPTLLVNAENDPFLGPECFPYEEARASSHFHLEAPKGGGHLGFVTFGKGGEYWSEWRAKEFLGKPD